MKYGLPYKGSKNKLAERIVRLLPRKKHLIDLFCGGCAVSHAALLMGKYEHIHINDINWMCPTLFIDALKGKYNDESRWISREDFFRLKDTDPYVAVVWSFGNNLRDYLYSREIEPLKKAIHYAMFFGDYSLGKELGHDLSFIDPIRDLQKRYLAVKHYFGKLGHFQQQSFGGGESADAAGIIQPHCPTCFNANGKMANESCLSKKKSKRGTPQLRETKLSCIACSTESDTAACSDYPGGGDLPITHSVLDYEDVIIPKDSVIYCDIPYEGTNVYNKAEGFDYKRFYRWCERQTEPVFISSYQMPDYRFVCIEEFTHRSTLSATANNLVTERIYIPKHQAEQGHRAIQTTLF